LVFETIIEIYWGKNFLYVKIKKILNPDEFEEKAEPKWVPPHLSLPEW